MREWELCGFGWAGLQMGIEVPAGIDPMRDWELPDGFDPIPPERLEEDVRVSIQERASLPPHEGVAYFHEGEVFEAGRIGAEPWIRRAGDGRVAIADPSFRHVRVALPSTLRAAGFPLAKPLDDLILIHRALEEGAFALRATASVRGRAALVILGDGNVEPGTDAGSVWRGWLLLRPERGGIRVCPLPSTRCSLRGPCGRSAWLAGLHVVEPITVAHDVVRVLDADVAAAELLRYAFVPISRAWDGGRAAGIATDIASRLPVIQLHVPGGARFAWQPDEGCRSVLPAGA